MVKQTNKNTAEIIKNNSNKRYSSNPQKKRNSLKDNLINEDLIGTLAEAYENERARQVIKWELVQKRNFQQTI